MKVGRRMPTTIEKYNIILDINHPDFEDGTGRQFYIKWVNRNYSECSYEFERDLILNDVEYLDQLASYERRRVKPTVSGWQAVSISFDVFETSLNFVPFQYMNTQIEEMKRLFNKSDKEEKKLYKIFGEKIKVSDEERERQVKEYQTNLSSHVFKNGGQLRDYQAEGVSWLMANHVNKRSSILADEMGLG